MYSVFSTFTKGLKKVSLRVLQIWYKNKNSNLEQMQKFISFDEDGNEI